MTTTKPGAPAAAGHKTAPGPRGLPIIGAIGEMSRKDMIQFYMDAWRTYGDVVRFPLGPVTSHLIVHPDDVKHVLLDNEKNYWKGKGFRKVQAALGNGLFVSEGALWKRQRRIMSPPFTPRAVTQFFPAMTNSIDAMLRRWETAHHNGRPFDVNTEMMRLAMDIIGRTMLSIDITTEALEASQAFTYVLEFASKQSMAVLDAPLSWPTPSHRRFHQAIGALDRFIYGLIDRRMAESDPPKDLLTVLLTAKDPDSGEPMSREQVRNEALTIFFAGHETTAQALTWAWYAVAQHPEIEARLHEEVERAINGRAVTPDDVDALAYPRMVVEEAMRLYPPVWVFARDAYEDDELGGYHVPGGSMIMLSQYLTHRHPEIWEEPERFDPERFTPERSAGRPRYAYFPFGGGPRVCLGNSFAMLEATLAVAMVAQRAHLRLAPGQEIRPKMVGTLRPNKPVMMTVAWK